MTTVVQVEAGPPKITQALPDGITASDLYNREITRRVPSTGKYVYLEREYGLSFSTVEEGAEITEQVRVSGMAYIVLISLLSTLSIFALWLDSSSSSIAYIFSFILTLGSMVILYRLSQTGISNSRLNEDGEDGDHINPVQTQKTGVLQVHLLTVALVIGAMGAVGTAFDQLSLLVRGAASLLWGTIVIVIFTDTGQTLNQRAIDYIGGGFRFKSSFIPFVHFCLVPFGLAYPLIVVQALRWVNDTFPAGGLIGFGYTGSQYYIFASGIIIGVMVAVTGPILLIHRLTSLYSHQQNTFIEDPPEFTDPQSLCIVALISLSSIAVVVTGGNYLLELLSTVFQYDWHPSSYPGVLVVSFPLFIPLYFATGGGYQLFGTVTGHILIRNSSSAPPLSYAPDAEVRVLSTTSPLIFADRVRGQDMIVVSEGLLQEVNQRTECGLSSSPALAALLAHEEGHVLHGDTTLIARLKLIGCLTFAPRNALYTVYNFRARELKADDHAQRQTSPDALETALSLMEDIEFNRTYMLPGAAGAAVAPFIRGASAINRVFGILYGDFMLTEAHPDLDDRRERLPE